MAAGTAEDAVFELLGRPARVRVTVGGGGPEPFRGRPWTADLDTVEFLKEREVGGHRLYAVGFEAEHVRRGLVDLTVLVRADREREGWVARRITGVSGGGEGAPDAPRVDLGGSWGSHGFCGGGLVHDPSGAVRRVRLRFENGVELEDGTEGGWVLFFTDRPVERPNAQVELLDGSGAAVSSFAWPWPPDLPDELRRRIRR